jgi:hypothetical protein
LNGVKDALSKMLFQRGRKEEDEPKKGSVLLHFAYVNGLSDGCSLKYDDPGIPAIHAVDVNALVASTWHLQM